jgi:hypothetical protein
MHPALYKLEKAPAQITLPSIEKLLGPDWTKIDENVMGEFGWNEILKQFLGEQRATPPATAWDGDHYVLYEQKQTKRLVLVALVRLDSEPHAVRFFAAYAEALQKKYGEKTNPSSEPDFLTFPTPEGGVYLRCAATDCISAEGTSRVVFDSINEMMGWPAAPKPSKVGATAPK